jgi:hypothetical protein
MKTEKGDRRSWKEQGKSRGRTLLLQHLPSPPPDAKANRNNDEKSSKKKENLCGEGMKTICSGVDGAMM